MPAPNAAMLFSIAHSSEMMNQNPQAVQKLAKAISNVIADACADFLTRVSMSPGVPCSIMPPPAMVGNVIGIGKLIGVPPTEIEIKMKAMSAIAGSGLSRPSQNMFAETISKQTAMGLASFMQNAQVLPGTTIANGVTVSPAKLLVPLQPIKAQFAMQTQMKIPGAPVVSSVSELPSDFTQLVFKVLFFALEQMASLVMVAPGIPAAGNTTVGSGRLM
ncbi:hypothetical protein [uncultured Paraglaciecola sp.]|uniref:hypothetical protein n=1 Tax=uncultured Paraglaciecola sp. TaxID=1765024 RepID=UPI0030DA1C3F|tara:strand:- start:60411 stop:61064 length:654 start_codon:yes stop_codon:yes gene_type:complete